MAILRSRRAAADGGYSRSAWASIRKWELLSVLATPCFSGGSGTGLIGSLLFELPLDYEWAIGIKGGIDFKNFSTTQNVNENVVVVADSTYPANINDNHTAVIKTTYLDFAPYLQYQFFRMGPFVQVGLDAGFLIANSLTQTRQLPEGTTIGGQTVTFTNARLQRRFKPDPLK